MEASVLAAPGATSMSFCYRLITPWPSYVLIYNFLMSAPAVLLLLYLIANARASVKKLAQSQSHIMATYYGFLWVVCLLNVLWCLLEGYLVSGWDALLRTLLFSGLFAASDAILKAVFIFVLGVRLFTMDDDLGNWHKWGFWLLHSSVFTGVYLLILILPHTRWKDRLPARPSFYRYVFILFVLNGLAVFGTFLLGLKATFGYCIYGLTSFCYYALYPPLLYLTFLSEFFQEEPFQAEDVYYSEMKDAGYFDTDWE